METGLLFLRIRFQRGTCSGEGARKDTPGVVRSNKPSAELAPAKGAQPPARIARLQRP
jgi:hypothetical protein